MRLDAYMVEKGLISGRDRAKELIASGKVTVNGTVCKKPSFPVENETVALVHGEELFVGRGAYKLQKALSVFDISVKDCICLDAGASTGGFTEILLKAGAARVYAVDVGQDQLAVALRWDERVVNLEKTDIRSLVLSEKPERFTADVSFISLSAILPSLGKLTTEDAEGVCLIKPQFEAGRHLVGKKGVVRDKAVHADVILSVITFAKSLGFSVKGLTFSPIAGQNGNIEYLIYLTKENSETALDVKAVIDQAWEELR